MSLHCMVRTIMLNKRGHRSEFRNQSPECSHYLIASLLCLGLFQQGLSLKNLLWSSRMPSTVDTRKSVPLGLFHTPIYMQLAVHLHHKKESLAEVLRVMGTQMPEWVNAALLPSIAWIVPASGQMQPRCVGWQG